VQQYGSTPMQCPPTSPGLKGRKFHLVQPQQNGMHQYSLNEYFCQFIYKGYVDIALRIFNHFGGWLLLLMEPNACGCTFI
jgi:hypothetical protein